MWFWQRKPKIAGSSAIKECLMDYFGSQKIWLFNSRYKLFKNEKDFLNKCPMVTPWSEDYDCDRQVMEAFGKLQGWSCGAIILYWKSEVNTHALIVVCFEDKTVKLFDVNSRRFFDVKPQKILKIWM